MCAAAAQAEDLFNGRDFQGWELLAGKDMPPEGAFTILAGGIIASSGQPSGFLATTGSYRNYRLHVEWRWSGNPGNSGVLLHISPGPMDRIWPLSLQVQTKHGNAGDLLPMAGYAFAEPPTSAPGAQPMVKAHAAPDSEAPAGEWNSADIVSRDGVVDVSINGVPQNRVTHAKPDNGRIGFQLEGAPYELRNVQLEKFD
ncbi:DUF1080 domain-containing protein [Pseudoduganella ginsengisoli]